MNRDLDAERLGETLRALRGSMSVPQFEKLSKVPVYVIRKLENAEIQKPAFEDLVKIGEAFGLTPNDMAALAGLYPPPEDEDQGVYTAPMLSALDQVRMYAHDLDRGDQNQFADMLSSLVRTEKQRKAWGTEDDSSIPAWLRRRVILQGAVGAKEDHSS